jgi:hypothetical protein
MHREMPLTYQLCFGDDELHRTIVSKMFVEEPVLIWDTRDFYGEFDAQEDMNQERDALEAACVYADGKGSCSGRDEDSDSKVSSEESTDKPMSIASNRKRVFSNEDDDDGTDTEWTMRMKSTPTLRRRKLATSDDACNNSRAKKGARKRTHAAGQQVMRTDTSVHVTFQQSTANSLSSGAKCCEVRTEEPLGFHEASGKRKKMKKRVYTVSKGISHLSSGRYKPHVKKMLDEAMIDKIVNPHDWLRVYARPGEKFTAKQTALMERTGLSALQIRHYMHNNSRKAKRIFANMVAEGWQPERTQPWKALKTR